MSLTKETQPIYWPVILLVIFQIVLFTVAMWRQEELRKQVEKVINPSCELKRYFNENNELDTKLELTPVN